MPELLRPTRDQLRAKHALAQVNDLKESGEFGNYASYVKALPAMILQSGLGQALATLLAAAKGKEKDAHRLVFDHVSNWLCASLADGDDGHAIYSGSDNLLQSIVDGDQESYLLAQSETLAYLRWLKKFSAAFLSTPEPKNDQ